MKFIFFTILTIIAGINQASAQETEEPIKKHAAGNVSEPFNRDSNMYYTFGTNGINESSARRYKSLGVTSIESYVTWESCERAGDGKWDFSAWDRTVKLLKENNLKWVPFLILGPAYSTPDWFRAGKEHFPCRCLEHGLDSKIESRWNPHLPGRIEQFISEFAKHYKNSGVIESVLLGIQGDYGEAIYSVSGGGWTFTIPGKYHNHAGYWCNDPYALTDFRTFIQKRYKHIAELNKIWGTSFKAFNNIDFTAIKDQITGFESPGQTANPQARRCRIDFIDWYRAAMTNWADWWIGTTRKYFPKTPIYLCTGGDAEPHHGSNFAEQTRVAAKHGAGIRITNEASDYKSNFAVTRWVASAAKHYGTYYGFEPAGQEDEKGIVARIYNATASGANQLHDYDGNVIKSQERINVQQEHLKYLFHVTSPVVPVALWYPNVSLTLKWGGYIEKAAQFRDYTDFDYIDESMLQTGALNEHRILVIIQGSILETTDAKRIADWIKKGGRVIVMDVPRFESVEGTSKPEQTLFGDDESNDHRIGKGHIIRVSGWDNLPGALRSAMLELRLPVIDLMKDGIFATQTGKNQWLFLNTTEKGYIEELMVPGGKRTASIKPGTITEVDLSKSPIGSSANKLN